MLLSKIEGLYAKHGVDRVCQGDILRDFSIVESTIEDTAEAGLETSTRNYPYLVVLTQDCDLEQDFANRADGARKNQDKYLQTILLCPAYPAEQVRLGTHLEGLGLRMSQFENWRWDQLTKNNQYRFHYLKKHDDYQVPELAIDFKEHLTVPREVLYKADLKSHYLATVNELYREDLSTRFAYFISRIALPT